jgi:acetolactate synthase-1/2/3 large subunit
MIVAAQVAALLYGSGIRRVHGLPGEDHMALLDAFQTAGLEYVAAFDETSAVLMAAVEAQLSGLPGVAVLSLAPGVSNGINGLLNTYLDEIPLLLISGQHPAGQLPFVVRQGFNIEQLVTPATRWRGRITADMDVPQVVAKALDEATGARPGPVYLELPDEVAVAPGRDDGLDAALHRLRRRRPVSGQPLADQPVVDAIAERLAGARRPVLVVGGRRRRLSPATTTAFAAAYRIPVFTTTRQKGLVHGGSPFFAGTFLNGRLEKSLVDQADLVLMVDPEAFDFYNKPWNFAAPAVAVVDAGFSEWGRPFSDMHVADAEATLRALTERASDPTSDWTDADVRGYRAGLRGTLLPDSPAFSVAAAVDAALAGWPSDGYLVADAGFSKPIVAMLSEPTEPDRFFSSNALSTMGYTIPATGALRHHGAGPVLAFLGDGSLLMRGTGLMAAAGPGPGTVYVALMDRALTQIEVKQERRKLATVGVTLPRLSCAKLGDAFGIDGIDVSSTEELTAAVAKGLRGDRPVLVGAHVDPAPSRVLFDVLRG